MASLPLQVSDAVYRIFQGMIRDFNHTGKALQAEMEAFPVEIERGCEKTRVFHCLFIVMSQLKIGFHCE